MKQKIDFRTFYNALALKAFKTNETRGRRVSMVSDNDSPFAAVLSPFLVDREKIRQGKAYRRLDDKTQVFIDHQENSHVRTRKIHTDEVASLSAQISSILGLNVYLAEAIAFGHDLGHSPFGHLGERVISELSGKTFKHEIMSVVIAQKIERSGLGLNLSWETLEGILHHSRGKNGLQVNSALPLESTVVMLADKIAYTFSDLNDAQRCGYFKESDLPAEFFDLGSNQRERWMNCIYALIKESSEKGAISFHGSDVAQKFEAIRQWSYANFYSQLDNGGQRQQALAELKSIYQFLESWLTQFGYDPFLIMALLTDREAKKIAAFAKMPTIRDIKMLENFSFMELISRFPKGHEVDIFNPDLNIEHFS